MTQKYKILEGKLAEELKQELQGLDLREAAKKLNRECTGEGYWYEDHPDVTPDMLMEEICELQGDSRALGIIDRKRDIELLYLGIEKGKPYEATLIYDVIRDKFLAEPILKASARKEAEYEAEHAWFERVARRLNRNLGEFEGWGDQKSVDAICGMLAGVHDDVDGGSNLVGSGFHMYIQRNKPLQTHTLLYDILSNEFMVGNAGNAWKVKFEPQKKKHEIRVQSESCGDDMTGIDILYQAAQEGLAVYIGEEEYYVHTMNKFFANLYKMTELDTLPYKLDPIPDPMEPEVPEEYKIDKYVKWEAEKKNPVSLRNNLWESRFPVTDYFLDIEEFRKAVIGNTRNSDLIRKMGLEPPEKDAPVIPVLQTDGSPYYTVGDQAYVNDELQDDQQVEIKAMRDGYIWYEQVDSKRPYVTMDSQRNFEGAFFRNPENHEAIQRGKEIEKLGTKQVVSTIDLPAVEQLNQSEATETQPESQDIAVGQRVTFQPHNGKTKLTGIVKEISESEVVLQCGRLTVPASREKGTILEAPEPEKATTKEFAKEQALKHVGEQGNVFTAKGEDATYKGAIVELTPTYAIQKVGEDAILHRLKDLESCKDKIHEGAEVSIAKGAKGVVTAEPWNKAQEQEQNQAREGVAR